MVECGNHLPQKVAVWLLFTHSQAKPQSRAKWANPNTRHLPLTPEVWDSFEGFRCKRASFEGKQPCWVLTSLTSTTVLILAQELERATNQMAMGQNHKAWYRGTWKNLEKDYNRVATIPKNP